MARLCVGALVVVASIISVSAEGFLSAKEKEEISTDDVQDTLQSLLVSSKSVELKSIEDALRPMFVALPKTWHGNLEHSTVRYALHRYFVQMHGWYMNGFDITDDGRGGQVADKVMKDRAPSFIQNVLEQRLQGEGLGLSDLAVFAATLSNLVHQESVLGLQRIFDAMDIPTEGEIQRKSSERVVKNFVVRQMLGLGSAFNLSVDLLQYTVRRAYPDWDNLETWVMDVEQTREFMVGRNPFKQPSYSFETAATWAEDISHEFGRYQKIECTSLKGRLIEMDQHGTGRVLLRDFYAGLKTDPTHHFQENVAYLRNLGALDESDPKRPSVMIPNYLMSKANCLASSGFYTICCSNECEGLLRHVEERIASPSASPEPVVEVISSLPSDSVDAPRNLSSALRSRLDEVARQHDGEVPLHGRLFAQWMHHAYPRECPFPHVSGTTTPLLPKQWREQTGGTSYLKAGEVGDYLSVPLEEEEPVIEALPWSQVEELLVEVKPSLASRLPSALRGGVALLAVASIASSLYHTMKVARQSGDKIEKFMV